MATKYDVNVVLQPVCQVQTLFNLELDSPIYLLEDSSHEDERKMQFSILPTRYTSSSAPPTLERVQRDPCQVLSLRINIPHFLSVGHRTIVALLLVRP